MWDLYAVFSRIHHYIPSGPEYKTISGAISLVFLAITAIYVIGGAYHGYKAIKKGF